MQSSNRTKHGEAGLREFRDKIQITFPRSLFNGKKKQMSTGLSVNPKNWQIAQNKVDHINTDIALGQFDVTLERYKPQGKQKEYQSKVTQLYPSVSLVDLYKQYAEYKAKREKKTTQLERQKSILPRLIESGVTSIEDALRLQDYLLEHHSESMTKRVLKHVHAAYKWGIKHKLLKGDLTIYSDLISELKHPYEKNPEPKPFSQKEKESILNAFKSHKIQGKSYDFYHPLIKFLFATGCRPNEAIGLTWGDVNLKKNLITFDGGVAYVRNQWVNTKGQGGKNNKRRNFPMNPELSEFLTNHKLKQQATKKLTDDSLVFPNRKGTWINFNNFSQRGWKDIINSLNIEGKYTPYSCRDTFISEQISKGVPPMQVAKWCDTSVGMIEKYYYSDVDSIVPL